MIDKLPQEPNRIFKKSLTKREYEVAKLIVEGYTAKQCAEKLNLSRRTVEFYVDNIKNKLCCFKKSDLIVKLIKDNIISI